MVREKIKPGSSVKFVLACRLHRGEYLGDENGQAKVQTKRGVALVDKAILREDKPK